ncbi:torsin-1B isoform X4 [Hydra vulgaris]|uniref:Torsin-1B isoform X4 n=1 Tax=Hydra vulgaris TaxID=6087 RepID=A0ABM4C7A3_HYDVU
MNSKLTWNIIFISLVAVHFIEAITTAGVVAVGTFAINAVNFFVYVSCTHYNQKSIENLNEKDFCKNNECCNDQWLIEDLSGLENELNEKVFGQHLANKLVSKAVKSHIKNKDPKSPLVMSFHGWTGTGKTFISQIVANSLFKKGIKNYHAAVDGRDYRKNIFIFLSNVAGDMISDYIVRHYKSNRSRESIVSKDLEKRIAIIALNSKGGFNDSNIIKRALINVYVPFLPLERKHVKQCAEADIKNKNYSFKNSTLEAIADELHYFPDEKPWFSATGCKTVAKKVDQLLSE